MTKTIVTVAAAMALLWGGMAKAASTCDGELYKAAGKYAACQLKVQAKYAGSSEYGISFGAVAAAASKCVNKYAATWAKLQTKFAGTGTTCDQPRFTDFGIIVLDNLTGLLWEKKTDDGTVHDKDNVYTWSLGTNAPDGSLFKTFLASLNGNTCFAGQCDWRIPTRDELQTIVMAQDGYCYGGCIDASFGPVLATVYHSDTTLKGDETSDWGGSFNPAELSLNASFKVSLRPARGVRGGL